MLAGSLAPYDVMMWVKAFWSSMQLKQMEVGNLSSGKSLVYK